MPNPSASQDHSQPRVVKSVACTRCSCLCDDLSVTIDGDNISIGWNGDECTIAQSWFSQQDCGAEPSFQLQGQSVTEQAAVAEIARILAAANSPLVYGLTYCNTDDQRAAVALADCIGGFIEIATSSRSAAPASLAAFQNAGASMSTLGEVRERADLVIYWGCDPDTSFPRLHSRFVNSSGRWVPNGRVDRHVVSVNSKPLSGRIADQHLSIHPGSDADLISVLRRSLRVDTIDLQGVAGLTVDAVTELVGRMRSCQYGVIFFGNEVIQDAQDLFTVESLHRLVTELNAHARFTVRYLDSPGNNAGAANVLAWQTGYPDSVSFSAGYPRYQPNSTSCMLERGEVDAVVFVGIENIDGLSSAAKQQVEKIPTIVLAPPAVEFQFLPTVRIAPATPGIHSGGTAYRMDDISLPLTQLVDSDLPTAQHILARIKNSLSAPTRAQ